MKTKKVTKARTPDQKLKDLLSQMIYESCNSLYLTLTYENGDLHTRLMVRKYIPKIRKAFGDIYNEAQK